MKLTSTSRILLSATLCLIAQLVKSQEATKTFIKNGNIYVQYDNAESRQLTAKGFDSQPIMANDKSFVIYLRTIKNPTEPEEGVEIIDETKIVLYNLKSSVENVIVQGCKSDGTGSSPINYSDSDEYPFSGLCNISNLQLSSDGQRVYFETSAWTVSNAIHYCFIPSRKLAFFSSGWLNKVFQDGNLNITITDIEQNKGRYTQDWLYDKNGAAIEAIGEKEF
jgi:hypothetical protein